MHDRALHGDEPATGQQPPEWVTDLLSGDPVNHPSHYTSTVPGIECIQVVEHFSFLRGNAIKYLWRAGAKGDPLTDLRKAAWYIEREIANLIAGTRAPEGCCPRCGWYLEEQRPV